jgi:predicted TPR repeat methyltransferase/RNA polymerase subunit RPABC4/transcription elongation factor Spt4
MADRNFILKIAGILIILAGIVMIVSSFYVLIIKHPYGSLLGVVGGILVFIIAGFEMGAARPIYKGEQGSYRSNLTWVALGAATRILLISATISRYNYFLTVPPSSSDQILADFVTLNVFFLAMEGLVLLVVIIMRTRFMPTKAEIEATMKRMSRKSVKTVAECPRCHEIVEKDWINCPQCGYHLPRICANCGKELKMEFEKCPSCGAVIERPEGVRRTIETLITLTEEELKPEGKSVRYARLAEAYLKAGQTDQALETYRKAIHYTEFDTKRCNFMVKMAIIYHNGDQDKEANELLEAALQLDPRDTAGAKVTMNQMLAHKVANQAELALKEGREEDALKAAEEALRIDPTDYHGSGIIKATVLYHKALEAQKAGDKDTALKLLNEAVIYDPVGSTPALELRNKLSPEEKKKVREKEKSDKKKLKRVFKT